MAKIDLTNKISELIESGEMCRVYFKETDTRTLIYGKFVALSDNEDMLSKGYVRFVIGERVPQFEQSKEEDVKGLGHVKFTRLYKISDFAQIK